MKAFRSMLQRYCKEYYATLDEVAIALRDVYENKFPDSKQGKLSASSVHKHLSGATRIKQEYFACYLEIFHLNTQEEKELRLLYKNYDYYWSLTKTQKETIESINKVFESFQRLSVIHKPELKPMIEPYRDDIYENESQIQQAIHIELQRELGKMCPQIDIMMPQSNQFYYRQIKFLLPCNANVEKSINIRQIVSFDNSKNKYDGEFNLLDFLPNIYYLAYSNPGSYQFYCSTSDCVISEMDGLIFPYYICTSSCLLRFSQKMNIVWVSHNQVDIDIYRKMFNRSLKNTRPLLHKCNDFFEYARNYTKYDNYLKYYFAASLCPIHFLPDEFPLIRAINKDLINQYPKSLKTIESYIEMMKKDSADVTVYFTENTLKEFARDGVIKEYPKSIVAPLCPEDRILLLKKLKEQMLDPHCQCKNYILSDKFGYDGTWSIGISERYLISYPMGLIDFDMLMIQNAALVNDFTFYYSEYLPNSEFVLPSEASVRIVDESIQLVESLIHSLNN